MKKFFSILFSFLTLFICLSVLTFGLYKGYEAFQLTNHGIATIGHVVDYRVYKGQKGGISYNPIIEFNTPQGETIRFESSGYKTKIYQINQQLNLLYEPSNPHNASMNNNYELWSMPLIFTLAGLFSLIFRIRDFIKNRS